MVPCNVKLGLAWFFFPFVTIWLPFFEPFVWPTWLHRDAHFRSDFFLSLATPNFAFPHRFCPFFIYLITLLLPTSPVLSQLALLRMPSMISSQGWLPSELEKQQIFNTSRRKKEASLNDSTISVPVNLFGDNWNPLWSMFLYFSPLLRVLLTQVHLPSFLQ